METFMCNVDWLKTTGSITGVMKTLLSHLRKYNTLTLAENLLTCL